MLGDDLLRRLEARTNSEPKRHHFVPKFYLRHFADHKKRIRMYERGRNKKPIVTSVNNAAVESGFYTVTEESGEESQSVERLLSLVESQAKATIQRMLKGKYPPNPEDRNFLALFMALQTLRTPEDRRQYEAVVDYTQKVMLEGWTPDYARERLKQKGIEPTDEAITEIMDVVQNPDKYRFVPHQNEHIRMMLGVAAKVAPVIAGRAWLLGHCRTATFITSDHPVVWYSRPTAMSPYRSVGLENAEEVYYPLDRHHVLALAPPGTLRERAIPVIKDNVLFVNSLVAGSSHKWVFQHPDDEPVHQLIPDAPTPLMHINGEPVFG